MTTEVACRSRSHREEDLGSYMGDMYPVTTYRRSYGPEQLKDLSHMIDIHHREFLISEGDRRIESLRLLRGYAAEYLSQVSHMQKFKFEETEGVLAQSVALIYGFEPREASAAFENLANYAHNLLAEPWRKDFHRLKTTSGFFTHNIRTHLQNPQEMLILLGYVATNDHTMVLAHQPDPVVLLAVSRDCFIASQECLILGHIWERVVSEITDCPLTLREVYDARKVLMGDTTTIVKHLVHQAHRREHELREERERVLQQQPYESHREPRILKHGFFPVDRLADNPDGRSSYLDQGIETRTLKASGSKRANGYSKKPFSISNVSQVAPSEVLSRHDSGSTSNSSPRSPSSCNSLKELQEVFYQSYLDQRKDSPLRCSDSGSEISELLEKHKQNVTQVDAMKKNRKQPTQASQYHQVRGRNSEFGTDSAPLAVTESFPVEEVLVFDAKSAPPSSSSSSQNNHHSRTAISTTSGFKGLKHHQDLPKSTPSTAGHASGNPRSVSPASGPLSNGGGLLGKIKGTLGPKSCKQDKTDHRSGKDANGIKIPLALTKSKIKSETDLDKVETRGNGILDKSGIVASFPPSQSDPVLDEEVISSAANYNQSMVNNYMNESPSGQITGVQKSLSSRGFTCPHCTYVNESDGNICEMCSKSKDFVLED